MNEKHPHNDNGSCIFIYMSNRQEIQGTNTAQAQDQKTEGHGKEGKFY